VRPTRADDDARVHPLNLPAFVDKLDKEAVGVRRHLRRRDPPLDCAAERDKVGFENPLGFVLGQTALKLISTLSARIFGSNYISAVLE
jgi:hypothetical protein